MPPAANSNALGTYLRARREQARPEAAGVPDQRNRRVPGLRREEVAFLAGVSSDYYVRLEQGRDKNPSEQVVLSIARALQLDDDATGYLLQLAQPASRRRKRSRKPEKVSGSIRDLIEGWPLTPAYVHGRYMDILAANRLATVLSPLLVPGRNAILDAFTEPEMRELYQDWEAMTARVVPYLRSVAGPDVDDPRLVGLVGELSLRSDRFRTLWARQDVRHKSTGLSVLMHPQVGRLELRYEKLLIPATDLQTLVTYHADPGSESHERLRLLAAISAPGAVPSSAAPARTAP
jgi:transcriptional regulator with XRE-family HTH domain